MENFNQFNVPCIQETDHRFHFTCNRQLNFLKHYNTLNDTYALLKFFKLVSVPCQRINKLSMHAHQHDYSTAGAIPGYLDIPSINCLKLILKLDYLKSTTKNINKTKICL